MACNEAVAGAHGTRQGISVPFNICMSREPRSKQRRESSDVDAVLACALQAIHHEAVEEQYENVQMSVLSSRGFSCSVQADLFLKVCDLSYNQLYQRYWCISSIGGL